MIRPLDFVRTLYHCLCEVLEYCRCECHEKA